MPRKGRKKTGNMAHNSCTLAHAVLEALQTGAKLPLLDESEEVAEELFSFHPGENSDSLKDKDGASPSKQTKSKTKFKPFLLLEAMRKGRLDAVQELHKVCPQLLTAIPLFNDDGDDEDNDDNNEDKSFLTLHSRSFQTSGCASNFDAVLRKPQSLFRKMDFHVCPHKRRSLLLNTAASPREESLLAFVLQNHPDFCKQSNHHGAHQIHKGNKQSTKSQKTDKCSVEKYEQKGEENEVSLTNLVNMCIDKNNVDVLLYLLYRYFWVRFCPCSGFCTFEIHSRLGYNLPKVHEETCEWFLHCAAFTGCSRLLHHVLSGQFCPKCPQASPSRSKIVASYTENRPDPNKLLSMIFLSLGYDFPHRKFKLAPLHLACWRRDPGSIQVLLNHGADVNLQSEAMMLFPLASSGEGSFVGWASTQNGAPRSYSYSALVDCDSTGMQDRLKDGDQRVIPDVDCNVLSPLFMLIHGIRCPPKNDFFSPGCSLGLTAFPVDFEGGETDIQTKYKQCTLKALQVLLEAGCDVNTTSLVLGKTFRPLEYVLKPQSYLFSEYHYPLSLDSEGEIVLNVSWELLLHGAEVRQCFSDRYRWALRNMDEWVPFNNPFAARFLHLAVFMGLFPQLDPLLGLGASVPEPGGSMDTTRPTHGGSQTSSSAACPHSSSSPDRSPILDVQSKYDRQQECLRRFVHEVCGYSVSQSCQKMILHFLSLSDLHQLTIIIESEMRIGIRDSKVLKVLSECVCQARFRTLQHFCKLAVLKATRWRPHLIRHLPLPECVKQNLLKSDSVTNL